MGGGKVSAARDGSVAIVQISYLEDFESAIRPEAKGKRRVLLDPYKGSMAEHEKIMGLEKVENGQEEDQVEE